MPLPVVFLSIIFLNHSFAGAETAPVSLDDCFQAMESFVPAAPAAKPAVNSSPPPAGASQLDFSLPVFGRSERVALNDFKGEIVVLDFFAHWCEPCRKASPQIEEGIAHHYAGRGGNRSGIPVHVLGINVVDSAPEATARFVEETGLERVLDDPGGKVLELYKGSGLPLVVVVDLTGEVPRIAYESMGFKGVEALRTTIDAISNGASGCSSCLPAGAIATGASGGVATHDVSVGASVLASSDISLVDSSLEYKMRHLGTRITLSLQHGYTDLDFPGFPKNIVSPGPLKESHRKEHRFGAQATARFSVAPSLALTVGGGGGTGFADYRSLWIDEFYHQLDKSLIKYVDDNFPSPPGPRSSNYQDPDPWSANTSADLRWEYLPSCGFLTLSANYSASGGTPSYLEGDLIGGFKVENKVFYTPGAGVSLENILTKRLRSQLDAQVQKTTDREVRTSFKGSFNYALLDHLVCRTEFSYAHEDPGFDGWSAGAVLEKDWSNRWFLSLAARYYEDTGEILDTVPENASPPAVQTYQGALALRWQGASNSLKASVGPYFNRYLEEPSDPRRFLKLYEDRDWIYANLAYVHVF